MTPSLPTNQVLIRCLGRTALLRGTALQAAFVLILIPAHAQPAPNTRPQGGQVVGGAATITRAPGATTINQSTDRAAIDWRSFDIGRKQSVTFQQPSSTNATLNRVTGPDPSAIAGRISANGQVILTNPNGETFFKESQVNAQSLVVSVPVSARRTSWPGAWCSIRLLGPAPGSRTPAPSPSSKPDWPPWLRPRWPIPLPSTRALAPLSSPVPPRILS